MVTLARMHGDKYGKKLWYFLCGFKSPNIFTEKKRGTIELSI